MQICIISVSHLEGYKIHICTDIFHFWIVSWLCLDSRLQDVVKITYISWTGGYQFLKQMAIKKCKFKLCGTHKNERLHRRSTFPDACRTGLSKVELTALLWLCFWALPVKRWAMPVALAQCWHLGRPLLSVEGRTSGGPHTTSREKHTPWQTGPSEIQSQPCGHSGKQ